MSDKIDQRIVEMSFENHKFEKGILQSKNSLKDFANALDKSGLDKDFSGLEKSVNSVSTSFSMLEQIGIGALRRIGEAAVDAGTKLFKSLSVDQLAAGWTKYEEKLDAVQTLVSAGYDLDAVRKEMEQLMWFSDETSYSFSDMATNMGKFVASGVDLKTSTKAMEGIATWAAQSGKNSQAASIAMFNLSQAISTGYVDTLNWRSIMGQNMNTVMFKQVAIGVAEATGAIKKGQVTIQNFDSDLKTKWFTNDVLLKTLDQYAGYAEKVREVQEEMNFDTASQAMEYMEQHAEKYGDVLNQIGNAAFKASQESKKFSDSINATMDAVSSGWMRTYEIIFGELDEAKANFSALTEILWTVFASGAENRNEMLQWVKELGGISNVFQGIKNVAVAFLTVLRPISKAIDQIFPPKTKEQWLAITEAFKDFTASLIITEESADKIRRTFAGVFAVIDIGWQVLKFLGSAAFEVAKIFLPLGDGFLGASASLGDLLVNIDKAIKSSGIFQYGLMGIKVVVALLRGVLTKLISGVSEFVRGLWTAEDPLEYLKDAGGRVFSGLIDGIKMVVSWLSGKFTKALKGVSGLFGGVVDESSTSVWSTILKILKEVVEFISGEAVDGFQSFGDVIKNLDLHKIATFVIGGVLLIFIKQITDLTGAMTGFTVAITNTVNGLNQKLFGIKPSLIRDIAFAFGVLAASIWVLSRIPADDLNKSLIGLAEAVGIFVVAYGLIQGINVGASKLMNNTKMISSAFGLTGVAASLLIMAVAVKTISKIDEKQVWNATTVLAAMLGFLTAYQVLAALISRIPNQQKVSTNLFGMSAAILALVGTLALLNLFTLHDLEASLAKMAGVLLVVGGLQGVFALAARIGGGNKTSVSILGMAAGIAAMIAVMKLLSIIDMRTVTQGIGNLALIALLLSGMEVMMGLAGRIGGGKKLQTNLLVCQLGLLSMVALIAILGTMKQETITRGIANLAKMAGIIAGIEVLTALSARISGGAKVQKILGSVALTLLAFAGVIAILGSFEQSVIDKGVTTLTKMVGLIAAIELLSAVASRIGGGGVKLSAALMGSVAAIVALTGSLALLSMIDQESLRGAAVSLVIASVAIVALSLSMDKISSAVNLMSKGTKGFSDKVKNIGLTLVALGAFLVASAAFFGVLALVLPIIEKTSWDSLGKFAAGLGAITLLMVVLDRIPMNDSGFMQRIQGLIPGFAGVAAVLIASIGFFAALKLVLPIVDSVSWESLGKFTAGLAVVSVLMVAMAALSPVFAMAGALAPELLMGVLASIAAVALVVMAVVGLAELLNLIIKDADALTRGIDLLVQIGSGIGRFVGAFAGGLVGGVLEGIGTSLAGFVESLSGFSPESLQGVKALAEAILIITAASLLDGIASFVTGKSSMEVFGTQLSALIAALKEIPAADASAASATLAAMKPMAENLKLFAEAAKEIPNSGGFIGAFMGENDIDSFGGMLARFVQAFATISVEQSTHMADVLAAMRPMAENLKLFASAAQDIPNSGGFLGDFMGNNDIDTFGTMLVSFVNAFAGAAVEQATHSTEVLAAMKPMAENLKEFAEAAQEIPNAGGFIGAFLGTVDLATFSEQIQGLVETFGTVDKTQLGAATTSLQLMSDTMLPALMKFSEFTNGLKASGGFAQLFSGNTTLSEFGAEFKKFVEQLSGVDVSIVAPAMAAMSTLNTSFSTMGAEVIDNATKSFENNKAPFQASIATILDEPIEKLETQKKTLVDTVSAVFKAVTDNSASYVQAFKTLGGDIIDGLKSGVVSKQSSAISSIRTVMTSLVTTAKAVVDSNSPSKVFETIGGWCTLGLANGLSKEAGVAVKAGVNMAKATEEGVRNSLGVHSLSTIFSDIGEWLPKSIDEGIQNGKDALVGTAEDLGINTGNATVDGVVSSIAGGESSLTSGIDSLLDLLTGTSTPAANSTGTDIGNALTGGFQNAVSNKNTGLAGSVTQATVKTELEKLKAIIEQRSFYGKITIEEELELYQKLRASYKEGSEERAEIDREVYTRLKTIYDAQISYIEGVQKAQTEADEDRTKLETDYIKDVAKTKEDAAKKIADLNAKYTDDAAKAKLDADKKMESEEKSYYKSLNSILENAEEDRQKLREQYASNQKSINSKLLSDIDSQNKAYESAVKSRADAIYNSYNLFAAVDVDAAVTGDELLKNLQDQGAALSEWKQSLAALADRGVGDALIEELQAMGPSTKAQIKALLTLTDEKLTEYVGLFEGKYAFARTKAEEELEGLKDSTAQAIQDLNAQAAIDLDALTAEFDVCMANVNTNMAADMAELRATHNDAMTEINADLQIKLTELQVTWDQSSTEIQADLSEKLGEMKTTYDDALTKINTDLKKNLDEMKTKFSSTMKEIAGMSEEELRKLIAANKISLTQLNTTTETELEKIEKIYGSSGGAMATLFGTNLRAIIPGTGNVLSSLANTLRGAFAPATASFESAGTNAASGFAQGIHNNAYQGVNAAEFLARAAVSAASRILDEHSPSKVFEGIGKFVSTGFANGIINYAKQAEKASEEMASGPIAAVSRALADMEESDDWSFTITPVLDLSAIQSSDIAQLLAKPISLGRTSSKLAAEVVQNGNRETAPITSIVNKFDLTGLTVREEADVDKIATKLYQKQQTAARGRGGRAPVRG